MHISARGVALIAGFEGFSSTPYWDAYGRVWTRGFGETEGITAHSPAISRAVGERRLRTLVEDRYEYAIRDLGRELTQDQWDALCSFIWNVGPGAILNGGLHEALVAGEWQRAASIMREYVHAGGVVLAGLVRRRQEETAIFLRSGAQHPEQLTALIPAERRLVNSYDRYIKHPRLHAHGLQVTREAMVTARKRIWRAAHADIQAGLAPAAAWARRQRAVRYRLLLERTKGLG